MMVKLKSCVQCTRVQCIKNGRRAGNDLSKLGIVMVKCSMLEYISRVEGVKYTTFDH